jgi:hypothetical protein
MGALIGLALAASARSALAGDDPIERLAKEASKAREKGHLEASLALLRRAYALEPLPVLLNNIARALEDLGRYREAAEAYRKVVADRAAEPALAAKDRVRLAELEPKIVRAWVQLDPIVDDGTLIVDGRIIRATPIGENKRELELDPGRHVFELSEERDVVLRIAQLEARTSTIDLSARVGGAIQLPQARFRIRAIAIDGAAIRSPLAAVELVHLLAGHHALVVSGEEIGEVALELIVPAGATVALETALASKRTSASHAALSNPSAAAIEAREAREAGSALGPYLPIGAGAAAIGTGAILAVLAKRDRDRVRSALTTTDPVITGITLHDADMLEHRANLESSGAAIAIGLGALAIAFGVGWLLFEQ